MVRILALIACNLTAGKQASYCKLHVRGTSLPDFTQGRNYLEHPPRNVLTFFELTLCPSLWQRNVQPRKSSSCLLACGILFLAVLYILFSSFFAYFLFPIHYNTNISGL